MRITSAILLLLLVVPHAIAFETDQYNLPVAPLADIGDEVAEPFGEDLAADGIARKTGDKYSNATEDKVRQRFTGYLKDIDRPRFRRSENVRKPPYEPVYLVAERRQSLAVRRKPTETARNNDTESRERRHKPFGNRDLGLRISPNCGSYEFTRVTHGPRYWSKNWR